MKKKKIVFHQQDLSNIFFEIDMSYLKDYVWEIDSHLGVIQNYLEIIGRFIIEINSSINKYLEKIKENELYYDYNQTNASAIAIALYLRYCIEIMVYIFTSNNRNVLDRYKSNDEEFYISTESNKIVKIIKKLHRNQEVDVNIYSILEDSSLLIIKELDFWIDENLSETYNKLSKLIHFFHYRHSEPLRETFNFSDPNDIKRYYLWIIDNFKKDTTEIENIYQSISNSLKSFVLFIEKRKALVLIENFRIVDIIYKPIIFQNCVIFKDLLDYFYVLRVS